MTQIVAAGNWTYALVVADRRFSVNGALRDEADDERNKLILVATPTARLAVAYCGLARLGAFSTERWLARLLYDSLLAGGGTPDLDLMCQRASGDFAALPRPAPLSGNDPRCLWIVLAGFVSEENGVAPVYAFVSNAEGAAGAYRAVGFHHEVYGPSDPTQRAYAMSMGAVRVDRAHVDGLKRVVVENLSPQVAVGTALRTIRAARAGLASDGPIGDRCGAAIVWAERDRQPEGWYFGRRGAGQHFMPTLVTRHGVMADITVDRATKFTARNAKCLCGSGRSFRRCHGASSSGVRGVHPT